MNETRTASPSALCLASSTHLAWLQAADQGQEGQDPYSNRHKCFVLDHRLLAAIVKQQAAGVLLRLHHCQPACPKHSC